MQRIARLNLLLLTIFAGARSSLCAPVAAFESMTAFMTGHEFEAVPLVRRANNQLSLRASINGHRASLIIDNGAPVTVIDRDSVGTFGLALASTNARALGIFGQGEINARGTIRSLQIGPRKFLDLPIAVADEAVSLGLPEYLIVPKLKPNAKRRRLSDYIHLDPANGVIGADVLQQSGAVLDCGHHRLYLRGGSANAAASAQLGIFLRGRGFSKIEMRRTGRGQFEVGVAINDRPAQMLVDTAASFTFVGRSFAGAAHIMFAPSRLVYPLPSGRLMQIGQGTARTFRIGDFVMRDTIIAAADVEREVMGHSLAGFLGIDTLSRNFAVIDFGNSNLYLRQPDLR